MARKAGLDIAIGDYIGFVDSDDCIQPEMYQKLYDIITATDCDFVHSGFTSIYENTGEVEQHVNFRETEITFTNTRDKRKFLDHYLYLGTEEKIDFSIWSKLFKASLIKSAYGKVPDNIEIGEDGIAFLNCVVEANSVYLLPESYYIYTVSEKSMSHSGGTEFLLNNIVYLNEFLKINGFQTSKYNDDCSQYVIDILINALRRSGIEINKFILKDKRKYENKKVILYGAGAVGKDYYRQLKLVRGCQIVGVTDTKYKEVKFEYEKLVNPKQLKILDVDYIIVAVSKKNAANTIIKDLIKKGVSTKIIWENPKTYFMN